MVGGGGEGIDERFFKHDFTGQQGKIFGFDCNFSTFDINCLSFVNPQELQIIFGHKRLDQQRLLQKNQLRFT